MSVSESEPSAILVHCRELLDAATQLNFLAVGRHGLAADALRGWAGDHGVVFAARLGGEADDLSVVSHGLRSDADRWARVWADAVNEINRGRREAAVELLEAQRSLGEQFVELFVGDDSGQQVRAFEAVAVPTAESRYAATGGLETF